MTTRRFTMLDAAAAGMMATAGVSFAIVGLGAARIDSRTARCVGNLLEIGAGSAQFASSSQGLMAGYTWPQGGGNSKYPDLIALQSQSLLGAHAAQAVDILRRRGRPDVPAIQGWLPDPLYWSLPLLDFQDRALGDTFNMCPNDGTLQMWRRDPAGFDQGVFLPFQPSPSPANKRWPYSSSYQATAGAFDPNQSILTSQAASMRISQGSAQSQFLIPGNHAAGPSVMSMVAMPSRKVHVYDGFARHRGSHVLYVGHADAVQPMLFFDGSVRQCRSGDARPAWNPQLPGSLSPFSIIYSPSAWEPPTLSGAPTEMVQGWIRWTRDGLLGWDDDN